MPHRRAADVNPNGPERRHAYRREEDDEAHTIVDAAIHDAPIVNRLLHTWKVAGAVAGLVALIASAGTAIGMSVRGPKEDVAAVNLRVDTNAVRILILRRQFDSTVVELRDLKRDIKTTTNLACISARARNPDVARAAGCDGRDP